jgi:hypothetical protein
MVAAIIVWGIGLTVGALMLSPLLYGLFAGVHTLYRQVRCVRPHMHWEPADGDLERGAVLAIVQVRPPGDHAR